MGRTQEKSGIRRGEHFSSPRRVFTGKTPQRTKHFQHMFGERTVINIGHVACRWRGTAFSRIRPLPTRTSACSRRRLAFLLPAVTEHTQSCVARIRIFPFSGTPRKCVKREHSAQFETPEQRRLVIPNMLYLHKQACAQKKKNFAYLAEPNTFLLKNVFFKKNGGISMGVRDVYQRPMQLEGSAKPSAPCSRCTL